MSSSPVDVVVLGVDCDATRAIYRALGAQWSVRAVLELPVPARDLIRGRMKRLGMSRVAGQVLFQMLVQRPLSLGSRRRIQSIVREHGLDLRRIPGSGVRHVESANDESTVRVLRELGARVVVVSGARILKRSLLDSVPAKFINMHAGITPRYRGVHGGYWALAEKRPDLVGTTVHLVDAGIDTGGVLEQVTFEPTRADNFSTYPYLHLAHGVPALMRAVDAALRGRLVSRAPLDPVSHLRYHPTLWEYLAAGVR